jgi:hypothetical protein
MHAARRYEVRMGPQEACLILICLPFPSVRKPPVVGATAGYELLQLTCMGRPHLRSETARAWGDVDVAPADPVSYQQAVTGHSKELVRMHFTNGDAAPRTVVRWRPIWTFSLQRLYLTPGPITLSWANLTDSSVAAQPGSLGIPMSISTPGYSPLRMSKRVERFI